MYAPGSPAVSTCAVTRRQARGALGAPLKKAVQEVVTAIRLIQLVPDGNGLADRSRMRSKGVYDRATPRLLLGTGTSERDVLIACRMTAGLGSNEVLRSSIFVAHPPGGRLTRPAAAARECGYLAHQGGQAHGSRPVPAPGRTAGLGADTPARHAGLASRYGTRQPPAGRGRA
jgi:hypothetical protein